jgi:hypothetical protein
MIGTWVMVCWWARLSGRLASVSVTMAVLGIAFPNLSYCFNGETGIRDYEFIIFSSF